MKTVIVIFCIASVVVGWMATHLGASNRIIIQDPGIGFSPGDRKEPASMKPREMPVKANQQPSHSRE